MFGIGNSLSIRRSVSPSLSRPKLSLIEHRATKGRLSRLSFSLSLRSLSDAVVVDAFAVPESDVSFPPTDAGRERDRTHTHTKLEAGFAHTHVAE